MSDLMKISAGERGVVRLFAIDLEPSELRAFAARSADWPVQAALGAETLDPDFVEVFDASDVAEIGLSQYLIQGSGVPEAEIADDRARLDGLRGPLMVVTSGAFGGRAQQIAPHAPLRWLGSWQEDLAPIRFEPLPDASARGRTGGEGGAQKPLPRVGSLSVSALVVVGLIVILAVWWGARG